VLNEFDRSFFAVRQFKTSVRPVKCPDTPFFGGKAWQGDIDDLC
jgi:hypothetical protein